MQQVKIRKSGELQLIDKNMVWCPRTVDDSCRINCALCEREQRGSLVLLKLHCAGGEPRVFQALLADKVAASAVDGGEP